MLISSRWLSEWVNSGLSDAKIADRMTMAGLEVGKVTPVEICDEKIVVGRLLEAATHPKNEKLKICMVDVGTADAIQVVCGAPNVSVGNCYPVALVGSEIDGKKIQVQEIHGFQSNGMLCSAKEAGFEEDTETLMVLDNAAPAGASLVDYLQLKDNIFDIELTPNRADCLSVAGVAREVSILTNTPMTTPEFRDIPAGSNAELQIRVESAEDCPRYVGRVIQNIRSNTATPDWMKERLRRSGLRSLHPVVDVTNYVMIELGQPMHAFDLDAIESSCIVVRYSKIGEAMTTLDGENLSLVEGTQVIADESKPIGLAGVMGGAFSGIRSETTNIFLEAAFFTPRAARFSVSNYDFRTEASHRFERGVDPCLQVQAMERATELILEISGGVAGKLQNVVEKRHLPQKRHCEVRYQRIARVLGVEIPKTKVESILKSVNKDVVANDVGWSVMPHSYRFDLEAEHDQIEEIARIYGYDSIPSSIRLGRGHPKKIREYKVDLKDIRSTLHHAGYFEAITYSFVDPDLQKKFAPSIQGKPLSNPIAENFSVMRTSLWPGLFHAFLANYRRRKKQICLYEIGRVFYPEEEKNMLGGIAFGQLAPEQWGIQERSIDFFDVKAHLANIFELTGSSDTFEFSDELVDGLHPGRSACIQFSGVRIGVVGQLHPNMLQDEGVDGNAYVFQLSVDDIVARKNIQYKEISRYPSITRDLSFLLDSDILMANVSKSIQKSAGNFLEKLILFDMYSGTGIDSNKKSVAYRLTFRLNSRTLTDNEIDVKISDVIARLNSEFNAELRK